MIQKVLFLFRASPYASACGCRYSRERALGYPPPPTAAPAHRQAEKEQNQKAAFGGKKSPACAGTKIVAVGDPSPAPRGPEAPPRPSPRGGSPFLLCFRRFGGTPSLWGGLGRGPSLDSRPLGRVGVGLTQGAGVHSCCVLGGWVVRPPLGEGWGGASLRGLA